MDSQLSINTLEQSLATINEAFVALQANDKPLIEGFLKDSCVKRFEYTMETSWKLMKKFLQQTYGKTQAELTINNIFRFMEGYELISSWERWRDYHQMRNDTSHEYNIKKSYRIVDILPQFISDVEELISNLKKHKK